MAALSDIRAGLAAAITAAITDAQCTGYTITNPTGPFFDIELSTDAVEYDQAMARGLDKWVFTVRGCVPFGDAKAAQMNLDDWCASSGGTSVKAALEDDLTLGGKVHTLRVTTLAGTRPFSVPPQTQFYLGAEWTVEIYAQG